MVSTTASQPNGTPIKKIKQRNRRKFPLHVFCMDSRKSLKGRKARGSLVKPTTMTTGLPFQRFLKLKKKKKKKKHACMHTCMRTTKEKSI